MDGGTNPVEDPFAGYTPVKPAVPVVDDSVPDLPQPKSRRTQKKGSSGNLTQVVKLLLLGLFSVAAIAVLSAVTYGFVHKRSAREIAPEFASFLERMRPLSEFGRSARDKVAERWSTDSSDAADRRSVRRSGSSATLPAAMTNVVLQKSRAEFAQQIADGEISADAVQSRVLQEKRRVIDPSLKKFKTGGRVVRPLRK